MIITASGTQEEIEMLLRAIRSRMSIEEWNISIEEAMLPDVSVEIFAGGHITATEAAERMNLTKGRISQMFKDGILLGYRDEGSVFIDASSIDDLIKPDPSALSQGYTVFELGKGGSGKGEFICHVDSYDEVKALAEDFDGVFVVGDVDQLQTVQQAQ